MSALFTDEQREALLANGRNPGRNVFPVVKLVLPGHEMVWLLTEINPGHENIAYGLCDLGLGFPEVGSVDLSELRAGTSEHRPPIHGRRITMDDTLESLRHQRNLLAAALRNVLGAYGVIRRDAPMTAPELLLAAETAIEGKRHGKPRQPEVRPWHPPDTIPDNGSEFEYLVAGSDRVHLGACYNDFGGTVRAEPNTTAWRWPAGSVEAIFEAEKETRLAVLLSQLQQAGGYLPRRRLSKGTYAYTISDAVREGYIELDGAVGLRITSGGLSKIVDLTYPEMEPEPEVTAPRCP